MKYLFRRFQPEYDTLYSPFDCGNTDLNEFLLSTSTKTSNATLYEKERLAITYVVEDNASHQILAYFSLINIFGFEKSCRIFALDSSKGNSRKGRHPFQRYLIRAPFQKSLPGGFYCIQNNLSFKKMCLYLHRNRRREFGTKG